VQTEASKRPASRILALTAYTVAAILLLAIPTLFVILRFEAGREISAGEVAWVFAGTLAACAAGLVVTHFLPMRMVRRIEDELFFKAEHDVLTGLLNRASLRRRIAEAGARADRAGTKVAVMFVDLDDFKTVNDTMGHAAGDIVLREAATRLRDSVRLNDVVARLGGDEFALVFEDIDAHGAAAAAAKLVEALRRPFLVDGRRHDISGSIGIAIHRDDDSQPDGLLSCANLAMRECKRRGKSEFAFFSIDLQAQLEARLNLQSSARAGWQNREFSLHYQPICDMSIGRLSAAEALLRWPGGEKEGVSVQALVGALEDIGLIGEVGEWVIGEACRQARAWADAGLPPFVMSVNVSPHQFRSGEALVSAVRGALEASGLHPGRLQVEMTESAMMEARSESLLTIGQLKALGVSIAVDDFGTGYSSLSYLKHFPVDSLKIDRVFVSELSESTAEANIVVAIVQLARGLNLSVIAEGVETEKQLELLKEYGCPTMQGYAIGRPLSAAHFEEHVLRKRDAMSRTQRVPVAAHEEGDDERGDRTIPAGR
jgi:diguanylate cyclase (GGDEF)-like protein